MQLRSKDEIMRTRNEYGRNRGVSLGVAMVPHFGKSVRVLSRVEKILDKKTVG